MRSVAVGQVAYQAGMTADFAAPSPDGAVSMWWLGQAGFAFRWRDQRFLLDPYLSDFLARKYAGTHYPHARMVPPPLDVERLPPLAWVFCTHAHSDHMDPDTLPVIVRNDPGVRFAVPRSEQATAEGRGLPAGRTVTIDAGQRVELGEGIVIEAIASAHEQLRTNARGEHHYLGYVLTIGGLRIYHSGDAVPYAGWDALVRDARIDVALLPVNGRDEARRSNGVPGNLDFAEAVALCRTAGIPHLVPHHFGMFDFNTVDPEQLRCKAAGMDRPRCHVPDTHRRFTLHDNQPSHP